MIKESIAWSENSSGEGSFVYSVGKYFGQRFVLAFSIPKRASVYESSRMVQNRPRRQGSKEAAESKEGVDVINKASSIILEERLSKKRKERRFITIRFRAGKFT